MSQSLVEQFPKLSETSRTTYINWLQTVSEFLQEVESEQPQQLDPMQVGSIEATLKNIRNTVIGNVYMKQNFVELGLLPIVRKLLSMNPKSVITYGLVEVLNHSLTIVGTIAKSTVGYKSTLMNSLGESQSIISILHDMNFNEIVWQLLLSVKRLSDYPDPVISAVWRTLRIFSKLTIASTEIPFKVVQCAFDFCRSLFCLWSFHRSLKAEIQTTLPSFLRSHVMPLTKLFFWLKSTKCYRRR
jgi:hypothetical protein